MKKNKVNQTNNLETIATEYNEFPKKFQNSKSKLVFIHKHGNLDLVLQGMDLICRGTCEEISNNSVMKVKTSKKIPTGHIFLGIVGSKQIANAYVHESTSDYAIIGSMSSMELE